ncbi:c2h2 type zinc finger domain protein [Colletotrichum incanum]|uniref:C2h2 type zinc finger domain protein n=1 Tax=Colletotrichum incanum TaxID=1573173 RepID=A0A167CMB1_COLIC|nr:c2h2 type zinc finger domain protein [Colletotrichum incanum]
MAANMQHMAGAAGMMQQQQPRPRPSQVQLNQFLYQTMLAQQQPHTGWQAGVAIQERMIKCHNLITNIGLAVTNIDFMKAAEVGVNFEREAFNKSQDKAQYEAQMSNKTNEFFRRRQANEQNLSNNLQAQAAAQAQQQLMMNQNAAMQNQMGRGMGQNQQQGFQHLQHQMQASQIPQQGQMGVNMGNQGGQPIGPNQQMFQMPGGQVRPQNAMPPDASSLTPHDQQKVLELAHKMAAACPEPQKNHYRNIVQTRFAQRAQEYTAQGKDPVLIWFQHQAFQGLSKNAALARQRQQQGGMPPNMNAAQAQALMQQAGRGQMNPAMMSAAGMQSANGDFGQFNTMESIMNQQKAGILAQEQGQMVVPASNGPARNATPQPIAGAQGQGMPNQAGPNQTPRPNQAQQQLSMQQAQQLKMEQQQSQQAAQMRAQQQARQLQGQPNGLGGAPPSQSPGMNTLNTPMRRPPSAMNPMDGQGGAQANGPFAGTLDPRFNQGNQRPMPTAGNMNMNNNPIFHNMMASMNPEQRQAVHGLPPDKLHEVMTKWQEQQRKMQMNAMAQAGNTSGQMQGRPGQMGQFNMPNGNQFMPNGMMPQQAQPGAPNNQQQVIAQQQQMLARLRNQGTPVAPAHQVMMDSMDLPPPVLQQVGNQLRAPPEVRKWKDLRQWLAQNPVQPQLQQHLERIQRSQFATYMQRQMEKRNREQQAAAAGQQQLPQQQQQQPQQPQQHMPQQPQQQQPQQPQPQQPQQPQPQPQLQQGTMQAGNGVPNQQQPNQPGMPPNLPTIPAHMIQVTPTDIMNARKANPKIASLTDDQLRQFIIQIKQRQMATAMQKEMAMRQAQAQGNQGPGAQNVPMPTSQPPQMPQPAAPPANVTPTPVQAVQPAPPKQQSATPDAKAVANAAAAKNNHRPTPNNNQTQPPNPSPATQQKSLKRPSTDEPADVPQAATQQPQRPAAVPGLMRPLPNLTPEQIASMTPEQKAKYEAMKSRQQAMQAANSGIAPTENDFDKLRRIGQEEQRLMMTEHMPDIPMSPEQRQETCAKLMKIVVDMGKIGKALGRWYAATRDDARAKSYFRARLRMIRQFTDGEVMTNPKPVFSVRPAEIDEVRRLLESMARDCANLGKKTAVPPQQGQPAAPNQAAAGQGQGGQPLPLSMANMANLEKQTQNLNNKMHNRSNSKSGPPAAPTTSQPPFPFGASSPHGESIHFSKPKVTKDNLQLPARKKAKTGTQPTPPQQPNQATPSPQISKSGSPELKRQPMPEPKAPPKPMFLCPEADCEMATTGFPSDQARQAHIQEEHVKPLEDPMKYMQESLAQSLGLDTNGQVKMEAQTAQPMGQTLSKQGQTPVSNTGATPMSRDASMQRTGSKMGGKAQDNKLAMGKTENTPKMENKQPEMAAPAAPMDAWATTIDPQSLFNNLGKFELGANGVISDMGVYRSLTPNDTPESSKDSGSSEPNSDISEGVHLDIDLNWQPVDVDLLLDMNSINMDGLEGLQDGGTEFEGLMLEEAMPMEQFTNWDEVTNDFNKPFQFDNSMYSLDVSSSM